LYLILPVAAAPPARSSELLRHTDGKGENPHKREQQQGWLVEWVRRLRREIPTVVGFVAVALFGANDALDLVGPGQSDRWAFAVAFVIFGLLVLRRLADRNAEIERLSAPLRIEARIGSFAANLPDPGPEKTSIRVHIFWEMWITTGDVSTERLGLNVIYVYDRRWWQFWKRTRFPQVGLPPNEQDSTDWRRRYSASDPQPVRDDAEFEFVADRDDSAEPHWLLEMVLVTGVPKAIHRVPVSLDLNELRNRGATPPL